MPPTTIYDLERIIDERVHARPDNSYTVRLIDEGFKKCAKKVGEEAVEFALEVLEGDRKKIIGEAADLLYHFLVALNARDITLIDIEKELALRHKQMSANLKSNVRGT